MKKLTLTIAAFSLIAVAAQGDWIPEDGHKMHYPQLPDPDGWDINIHDFTLADDWQCSQTGPVSDVHFWVSYPVNGPPSLTTITLSIHGDIPDPDGPGPGYSMPGPELWGGTFTVGEEATSRGPFPGDQGFAYDPGNGDPVNWVRPDHTEYWQINIQDIPDPFTQQEGNIYWLDVHTDDLEMVGWKTSTDHFNDRAVFFDEPTGTWLPIIDNPDNGERIDMAFVITPEPGSAMLALLGAGLCLLRRRMR